jgi:hypothetical protein
MRILNKIGYLLIQISIEKMEKSPHHNAQLP